MLYHSSHRVTVREYDTGPSRSNYVLEPNRDMNQNASECMTAHYTSASLYACATGTSIYAQHSKGAKMVNLKIKDLCHPCCC
jgi:hypothetical protein